MSLDAFLADIAALREHPDELPVTSMRVRWARRRSNAPLFTSRREVDLALYLYPAEASARDRAGWQCWVDAGHDVEGRVEQGTRCEVVGELAPGRGVMVRCGRLEMLATYPLRAPLRGPRLGG